MWRCFDSSEIRQWGTYVRRLLRQLVGPGDGLSALSGLHTLAVRVERMWRVATRGAPCGRRRAMSDPLSRTLLLHPVLLFVSSGLLQALTCVCPTWRLATRTPTRTSWARLAASLALARSHRRRSQTGRSEGAGGGWLADSLGRPCAAVLPSPALPHCFFCCLSP